MPPARLFDGVSRTALCALALVLLGFVWAVIALHYGIAFTGNGRRHYVSHGPTDYDRITTPMFGWFIGTGVAVHAIRREGFSTSTWPAIAAIALAVVSCLATLPIATGKLEDGKVEEAAVSAVRQTKSQAAAVGALAAQCAQTTGSACTAEALVAKPEVAAKGVIAASTCSNPGTTCISWTTAGLNVQQVTADVPGLGVLRVDTLLAPTGEPTQTRCSSSDASVPQPRIDEICTEGMQEAPVNRGL